MRKTTKVIVGSALTMAMCATLITGATLALFTGEDNVNIAVSSGKVDVQASVTAMQVSSNAVTDDYNWQDATQEGTTLKGDFATNGTATYSVDGGTGTLTLTNIAPGDAVKFTLSIANNSNISIKYQTRIAVGEEGSTDPGDKYPESKLSAALELQFAGRTVKGFKNAATAWSEVTAPTAPETTASPVKEEEVILRLPKDAGPEYASKSCEITLSVVAIQGNGNVSHHCELNGGHYYDDSTGTCIYCGAANPFAAHHTETGDTYTITGVDTGVTDVVIPAEINGKKVGIGSRAFSRNSTIESVTFEENVQFSNINQMAFFNCTNLREVTFKGEVDSKRMIFTNCKNIECINVPDLAYWFRNGGKILYSTGASGEKIYANGEPLEGELIIPEGTTSIDPGAFHGYQYITKVTIPDEVKIVLEGPVHNGPFDGCSGLQEVSIGAQTVIGTSAFEACHKLQKVTISKDCKTVIGEYAFASCDALTELLELGGITGIGDGAFSRCTKLEKVVIPGSCKVIGNQTTKPGEPGHGPFECCTSLKYFEMQEGVEVLGEMALLDCRLETVVIPSSLKTVVVSQATTNNQTGYDLFGYFHDAKHGYTAIGSTGNITFEGTSKNVTVYFHGTKETLQSKLWYTVQTQHNYQSHGEDAEKKYCREEDVDWFYLSEESKTGEADKYWNYDEEGVPTPWET